MEIPTGPEALTTDWLTSALRGEGAISKASVVSYKTKPLGEDQGFRSQIARVNLDYDLRESNAPQSLIAKFSSATPEMRERAIPIYKNEVLFYQQLAHQTDLPTPTCYYSDIDTETGMHVLLLEDLAPAHSGSRVAGCSIEQAELAIRHIANFHASWWEKPQLEELTWLTDIDTNLDPVAVTDEYNQWWPIFFQQAKHRLPDPIKELGERLDRQWADIRTHIFTTLWNYIAVLLGSKGKVLLSLSKGRISPI